MGEVAEMMLEGILCQGCGQLLIDGPNDEPAGYPQHCAACGGNPKRGQRRARDSWERTAGQQRKPTKQLMHVLPAPGAAGMSLAAISAKTGRKRKSVRRQLTEKLAARQVIRIEQADGSALWTRAPREQKTEGAEA